MMPSLVLGGGRLGGTLATRLAELGSAVTVSVPNPQDEKYEALRNTRSITVASSKSALPRAHLTFIATPWEATEDAIASAGDMNGRIVVDCTNPVTYGPSGMALAIDANTSAAEMIRGWLPADAKVVKAFNQLGSAILAAPDLLSPAPICGVASDDLTAKSEILDLSNKLGFDAIDAGGLANARLLEAYALLWMTQAFSGGDPTTFAFGRAQKSR